MVQSIELQALYTLLANAVDGFNRTHGVQVNFLDFSASLPIPFCDEDEAYDGSLVFRVYNNNVLDYWYEAIPAIEMYPFTDQSPDPENIKIIKAFHRRESQRRYRAGVMNLAWWQQAKERLRQESYREAGLHGYR